MATSPDTQEPAQAPGGLTAGKIALISLVPLAVAGSAGTIAINIGPGNASASEPAGLWGEVKNSADGQPLTLPIAANAISPLADAWIEVPVAKPRSLGEGLVPVPIHYRLSDRKGWVNARITASVLGKCRDALRRPTNEAQASQPPCERWFEVPGAREGPGILRVWVPEAQIRASQAPKALRLHVQLQLDTQPGGDARFEIERIEVGR